MLKLPLNFILFSTFHTNFSIWFYIKAGLQQAQSFSVSKYGLQLYTKFFDTSPKMWLETTALLKLFCIVNKPTYCNAPRPRTPDSQPAQVSGIMHFKSVNILWIFLLDQMCAAQLDMALHKYVYEMSQHSV